MRLKISNVLSLVINTHITDKHSLDFVLNRTFMKLFRTSSIEIVNVCQLMFGFKKISETVIDRKRRFLERYKSCDNIICETFTEAASAELILCGPTVLCNMYS